MPKIEYSLSDYASEPEPQQQPKKEFELIPKGFYYAELLSTSIKEYRSGNGKGITFDWEILAPSHAKRRIWDTKTVEHTNTMAQDIGRHEIARIAKALGKDDIEDTSELVGLRCEIFVDIEPAKGDWKAKNIAKKYRPYEDDGKQKEELESHMVSFDDDDIPF